MSTGISRVNYGSNWIGRHPPRNYGQDASGWRRGLDLDPSVGQVRSNVRSNLVNFKPGVRKFLLVSSLLGGAWVLAQDSTAVPADNTKVNQRDQNANQPTADQQRNKTSDRDMTQQIRKAIVKDKSLSTYAHNVKIITQNGQVTLKGPVRSDDEKRAVEAKAAEVAGQNNVTSQLGVEAKK
jgi:hyperosmotically inducible protein